MGATTTRATRAANLAQARRRKGAGGVAGEPKKPGKSVVSKQVDNPHTRPRAAGRNKLKAQGEAASARQRQEALTELAAPRIEVRRSKVHGLGVVALERIAAGATIIEYTGERISWKTALARHPHDPEQPHHTFYFHLTDSHVIDAKYGGNDARWINHACDPNCEAEETGGRVFIKALRNIKRGEELNYDYGLVIDARQTPKLKAEYACRCGSPQCRGTMLAPKTRSGSR